MKFKDKVYLIGLSIASFITNTQHSFLGNDKLRFLYCKGKFNAKKIRTYKKVSYALRNTLTHNLSAFNNFENDFIMQRSKRLIFALLANETINYSSKILILGPRTENEIYFLYSLGFTKIYALDLISYTEKVKLGDMHKIPFSKNAFDAVICGWTLSYSKKPGKVIQQIIKVLKPNGLAAFGFEYFSKKELKTLQSKKNYKANPLCISDVESCKNRVNSTKDLLKICPTSHRGKVVYKYDAYLKNKSEKELYDKTGLHSSQVMCIIEVLK